MVVQAYTLPETSSSHLKIGRAPKGKDRLVQPPTSRGENVSFRQSIYLKRRSLKTPKKVTNGRTWTKNNMVALTHYKSLGFHQGLCVLYSKPISIPSRVPELLHRLGIREAELSATDWIRFEGWKNYRGLYTTCRYTMFKVHGTVPKR